MPIVIVCHDGRFHADVSPCFSAVCLQTRFLVGQITNTGFPILLFYATSTLLQGCWVTAGNSATIPHSRSLFTITLVVLCKGLMFCSLLCVCDGICHLDFLKTQCLLDKRWN